MSPPARLTFELEALATKPTSSEVVEQLVFGLQHEIAFVREGAIYGCVGHLGSGVLRELLAKLAEVDPDADVREIARDVLLED